MAGIGDYTGEGEFKMKNPLLRGVRHGAPMQANYSKGSMAKDAGWHSSADHHPVEEDPIEEMMPQPDEEVKPDDPNLPEAR